MKPKNYFGQALILPLAILGTSISLIAWNKSHISQSEKNYSAKESVADTVPQKEKIERERKIRDLDEALQELDKAKLDIDMDKINSELENIRPQLQKELANANLEVKKALKEIDVAKLKSDVEASIAKIDWEKMKHDLDKVQEINMEKMNVDMKKVDEELKKIKPDLEKNLQKAKIQIEKAKSEMKEYKTFVDGLEKDGLINKKEGYSIKHKEGELIINGKKQPEDIYRKYQGFLHNHKNFSIEKNDADFNFEHD
jgi:hypothetical protein